MLETRAVVIRLQGREALVESMQGGGCGQCSSSGGCSSGNLSKMFCNKPRQFVVDNTANAAVGDEVKIELPAGVLLRSALTLYMLPLALLFAGGMCGASFASETVSRDTYAALGAFFGLILGFCLARILVNKQNSAQPTIVC
jgi:sigma-E factor negative regulatory protein RseC